ncbi:hypothetical protein BDP81DRAFT_81950 [Colletotrichum phormii]|uniref:Uncharacterized protein n=1 Tax=Colletotrichum phormii TaxID=359342 RepID=A0AAJ0A0S8_9PEZI|nr:uncharacterized protein BDP81DRAFT_81950 [Colletotrichum phormii]KAK1654357.1 hypothetical protein BDP81DRAFT_81950 [Colletotrichum phormii]
MEPQLRMPPPVFSSHSSSPTRRCDSARECGWPCLPPGFSVPTRHIHYGFHPFWGSFHTPFHCKDGVDPPIHQQATKPLLLSERANLGISRGPGARLTIVPSLLFPLLSRPLLPVNWYVTNTITVYGYGTHATAHSTLYNGRWISEEDPSTRVRVQTVIR